ncbi:hypothetical protein [Aliarcobacter butzleri]|uniref:hypothetical protein n=1 Tax=Aliarcobacter butzleri TaxID=28197 RepID=UPI003450DF48
MNLQQRLYQYCKENKLEDITCIIQFTIVNYVSSHKTYNEWIHLSPQIINSFLGIGEDKINDLFKYLSGYFPDCISVSYETFCPNEEFKDEFCQAINLEDYKDEEIELSCSACGSIHTISKINEIKYNISYEGNKEKIIKNLKISSNDIAKEMIIVNTNAEHLNKLADILVSRLTVEKGKEQETKKGLVKILGSIKEVTGLISGIAGDVSSTSKSVKNIIEDFTGLSTLQDFIK